MEKPTKFILTVNTSKGQYSSSWAMGRNGWRCTGADKPLEWMYWEHIGRIKQILIEKKIPYQVFPGREVGASEIQKELDALKETMPELSKGLEGLLEVFGGDTSTLIIYEPREEEGD